MRTLLCIICLIASVNAALKIRWIVINDLHTVDNDAQNPYAKLGLAVRTAKDSACNFMVINGDLMSSDGTDSLRDSTALKRIKDSCAIYDSAKYYIAGNHDTEHFGVLWWERIMGQNRNQMKRYGKVEFVFFYTGVQYDGGKDTSSARWLDSTLKADSSNLIFGFSHWILYDSTGGYFSDFPGGKDSSAYWRNILTKYNCVRLQVNGHGTGAYPKQNNIQYFTSVPNNYYVYPNNNYYMFTYDTTTKQLFVKQFGPPGTSTWTYSKVAKVGWDYDSYYACLGTAVTNDTIRARLTRFGMTDTVQQKFFIGLSDTCNANGTVLRSTRRFWKVSSGQNFYEVDRNLMNEKGDVIKMLVDSTSGAVLKTNAQAQ